MLAQCISDDAETIVSHGCVLFKEEKYEEARVKFTEAMQMLGYQADLSYNIALCYYRMKIHLSPTHLSPTLIMSLIMLLQDEDVWTSPEAHSRNHRKRLYANTLN